MLILSGACKDDVFSVINTELKKLRQCFCFSGF